MRLRTLLDKLINEEKLTKVFICIFGVSYLMQLADDTVIDEIEELFHSFLENLRNYHMTDEMSQILFKNQLNETDFYKMLGEFIKGLEDLNKHIKTITFSRYNEHHNDLLMLAELTLEVEESFCTLYNLFCEEIDLCEEYDSYITDTQISFDLNSYLEMKIDKELTEVNWDDAYINIQYVIDDWIQELLDLLDYLEAMADFISSAEVHLICQFVERVKEYLNSFYQSSFEVDMFSAEEIRNFEYNCLLGSFLNMITFNENQKDKFNTNYHSDIAIKRSDIDLMCLLGMILIEKKKNLIPNSSDPRKFGYRNIMEELSQLSDDFKTNLNVELEELNYLIKRLDTISPLIEKIFNNYDMNKLFSEDVQLWHILRNGLKGFGTDLRVMFSVLKDYEKEEEIGSEMSNNDLIANQKFCYVIESMMEEKIELYLCYCTEIMTNNKLHLDDIFSITIIRNFLELMSKYAFWITQNSNEDINGLINPFNSWEVDVIYAFEGLLALS